MFRQPYFFASYFLLDAIQVNKTTSIQFFKNPHEVGGYLEEASQSIIKLYSTRYKSNAFFLLDEAAIAAHGDLVSDCIKILATSLWKLKHSS